MANIDVFTNVALSSSSGGAVTSVSGTTNQVTVSPTTGAAVVSLPNAITTPGTITLGGAIYFSSGTIAAAGTNQGTATAITADNTYVTSGTGGVILPVPVVGREISVTNTTGASINLYPSSGTQIETAGNNTAVVIPNNASIGVEAKTTTQWWTTEPVFNGSTGSGSGVTITQSANGTVTWGLTTPTTQSGVNNSTSIATTAYADRNYYGVGTTGWKDDFINNYVNAAITTLIAGNCDTPWFFQQITGGTQAVTGQAGTFNNPGQFVLTTSAVSGDGIAMFKSGSFSAGVGALGSTAGWERNMVLALSTTTNIAIRAGFCVGGGATATTPTSGMWVEFDTANTGNSATNWTWVVSTASTPLYYTTNSSAPVASTFVHLRIRSTTNGTIGFTINGGTEFTTSTSVPTQAQMPFIQLYPRTTSAVSAYIDFDSYVAAPSRT